MVRAVRRKPNQGGGKERESKLEGHRNLGGMIIEGKPRMSHFQEGARLENMGWGRAFYGKRKRKCKELEVGTWTRSMYKVP